MEVPDGVVPLLELVCVADVVAILENEVSLTAFEDVANATTDDVCETEPLESAGICRIVCDEEGEKLADKLLVEGNKID